MATPEDEDYRSEDYWRKVNEGLVSEGLSVGEATGIVIPDVPRGHEDLLAKTVLGLVAAITIGGAGVVASRYVKNHNAKEE